MSLTEIIIRVNGLFYDGRENVTTTPKKLLEIFNIPKESLDQTKTIILNNLSDNDIYYGATNSISVNTAGGIIQCGASRELPLMENLTEFSPYFTSSLDSAMGIELWG